MSGAKAMMDHQYRVTGDFNTMHKMNEYFGQKSMHDDTNTAMSHKTNMTLLILPWFLIWVFIAISPVWGGVAGILGCAFLALAGSRWELTLYDRFSIVAVTILSLLSILNGNTSLLVTLSYALFGVMWMISCLSPVPLTAHYSKEGFGGEKAYQNPLFMQTNRILTLCWGILYLLTTIWTYFLMGTSLSPWTGLINSACPALMGVFTAWFQKWYPAKVARSSLIK
jgi:hypothetical protein